MFLTGRLLRGFGCRVSEATNWEHANKLLRDAAGADNPFQVVLVDSRRLDVPTATEAGCGGAVQVLMSHWGDRIQPNEADSPTAMRAHYETAL